MIQSLILRKRKTVQRLLNHKAGILISDDLNVLCNFVVGYLSRAVLGTGNLDSRFIFSGLSVVSTQH